MRARVFAGLISATVLCVGVLFASRRATQDPKLEKVGQTVGTETLVATGQQVVQPPETLIYGARPIDMVLSKDGRFAYVKDTSGLTVIDLDGLKVASHTKVDAGESLYGIALSPDGSTLAFSDAASGIEFFKVSGSDVSLTTTLALPKPKIGGEAFPCGLAFSPDGSKLFAALNRSNAVAVIDLATEKVVNTIPVDPCPVGLALADAGRLLVTCWAGPVKGPAPTADSSGTPVLVDERGIGLGGTLCEIRLAAGAVSRRMPIGFQATEIAVKGDHAYVASGNSDQVFDVDLSAWQSTPTTPLDTLRPGSAPTSVAVDSANLYIACGGRNTVLRRGADDGTLAETRTPWYPISVRLSSGRVVVACNEGMGMRTKKEQRAGWNTYDFEGSITILGPDTKWTAPEPDTKESQAARSDTAPAPVPLNVGEASTIQHVVYILKENRTYDQLFGDIGKGDSDPTLTIYGKNVTPNQHALANEFVLLDNYYCNGVLSADGHAWAMEGNATPYFQRTFGGWTRSYPFGDDPLSVSRSGFIWDDVIDHGLSFKNFGEFDYATPKPQSTFLQILRDFQSGANTIGFAQNIGVARVRAHSQQGYPGWNLGIPDVLRAHVFIQDLALMERDHAMPSFTIVYLPQDHTSGGSPGAPTPRAQVADNDLAVGQVVEAISKSSFWPHTAIFVNEDDPQNGFDHVDGHRSICLVVSPYARRHTVVSDFYNQTSVLRTIEHMLGIPPMNRFDAGSPLMTECFQSQADLTPFTALPNEVPIDEMTPSSSSSVALRLDKPDQVDDDLMNRRLWRAARGSAPYPARFAGPHGLGLARKGLKLDPNGMQERDVQDSPSGFATASPRS